MATKKLTAKEKEQIAEASKRIEQEAESRQNRVQIRKLLAQYEPTAYRFLDQALKTGSLPHACLFLGPKGSLKKDMAFLVAGSLFAKTETGLAEEENLSAEKQMIFTRMAAGDYSSLILIDGYRKSAISKDEADEIQSRFSVTAAEGGVKVYIIDHMENSSDSAQNSLLKFLEEPARDVYAILTADHAEGILPTIRSRCVIVPFRPLPADVYRKAAEQAGLDPEDAFFLSGISSDFRNMGDQAASYAYQTAKQMLKQYLNVQGDRRLLVVDYEARYRVRSSKTDESVKTADARDANLDVLQLFFSMVMQFCKSVLVHDADGPAWYHNAVSAAMNDSPRIYERRLRIAMEERDRVNRNNDLSLLFAQAMYRMEVES
jgi:DNA polymerase-3 subunit delta'